jgi:hypothetical protein
LTWWEPPPQFLIFRDELRSIWRSEHATGVIVEGGVLVVIVGPSFQRTGEPRNNMRKPAHLKVFAITIGERKGRSIGWAMVCEPVASLKREPSAFLLWSHRIDPRNEFPTADGVLAD